MLDAIGIPTARIVRADRTPRSIKADLAGLLARNRLGVRLERMKMARSYIGEMGQNWQEWSFCSIDERHQRPSGEPSALSALSAAILQGRQRLAHKRNRLDFAPGGESALRLVATTN